MSTCNITTEIPGNECIGASRVRINNNFAALESVVCPLSTQTIQVQDSLSIDLTFNSGTRTLTADVIPGVINNQNIATGLSANDEFLLRQNTSQQLRKISFVNLKANILPPSTISYITTATDINVYIDGSGSMTGTESRINEMVTYYLSAAVLPFYNNNVTTVSQRLKVYTFNNERCFDWVKQLPSTGMTNVVNIAIINEAGSIYHNNALFKPNDPRSGGYTTDITALRTNLQSYNMRCAIMQVIFNNYSNDGSKAFRDFLYSVEKGIGNYSGNFGLSDKLDQVSFVYDLFAERAPSYYADLLYKALLSLQQ
jgi:hypothetical protein